MEIYRYNLRLSLEIIFKLSRIQPASVCLKSIVKQTLIMVNLTEGACALDSPIYSNAPFVQVLSIHKLSNSKGFGRHKLVVSDGVHFRSAILAKHLDQLITCQQISALCVIQMEDFVLTRDEESEQVISFFPIFALALNFFFQNVFYFKYCSC